MLNVEAFKESARSFLRQCDWDGFCAWFAPHIVIEIEDDTEENENCIKLVYSILRVLTDFDEGFIDEYSMRRDVECLLYPKATMSTIQIMGSGLPCVETGTRSTVVFVDADA